MIGASDEHVEMPEVRGAEFAELRLLRDEGLHRQQADNAPVEASPAPVEEPVEEVVVEPAIPELTGIEAILCSYDWPCWKALDVGYCESGPDLIAGYNAHGAAGTMQLMPVHAHRFAARGWNFYDDALDPVKNIAIAYELWLEQGWWPWACA